MPDRAAIITGASSGIGLAIARMLGSEGYGLTVNGRRAREARPLRPPSCATPATRSRRSPEASPRRTTVKQVVDAHRERFGRLDVLVNNAGAGWGQTIGELTTKALDLQLGANFRHIPLFYREALPMLRAAAAEHRNALVINTSSISGKRGEGWLSVYSATKHAVVGFTEAMNKELGGEYIKSCALCPAFVDTPMTDFLEGAVPIEKMITTEDVATMVRALLHLSPGCTIPEIVFEQTGFTDLPTP